MLQKNSAKFAFFYMLSLVGLLCMSISTGMIIFQIINKNIPDVLNLYQGTYNSSDLKSAISVLLVSTPIYYLMMRQIFKNLYSGDLDKDSGVRKWLTYFIILIASVVMIGWLIGILNNFLDGELTIKFILKAITSLIIAGSIFSFYFYDIKRENVLGVKDQKIKISFYVSLAVVVVVFVSAFFIVESPTQTRNRKMDEALIMNFDNISYRVDNYYNEHGKMPSSLDELKDSEIGLTDEFLIDPVSKEKIVYKPLEDIKYELCATFKTSTQEKKSGEFYYPGNRWMHDIGYQCLKNKVNILTLPPKPIRENVIIPQPVEVVN